MRMPPMAAMTSPGRRKSVGPGRLTHQHEAVGLAHAQAPALLHEGQGRGIVEGGGLHTDFFRLVAAQHAQGQFGAGHLVAQDVHVFAAVAHGRAVDAVDDVAGLDAGLARRAAGVETGDLGRNRRGVQEFEDTDAFVAFLDIEPMHELGDDDGVAIALGHLDVVEVGPLAGELRAKREQGHKVA